MKPSPGSVDQATRDIKDWLHVLVEEQVARAVAPLREQVAALTEEVARLRLSVPS